MSFEREMIYAWPFTKEFDGSINLCYEFACVTTMNFQAAVLWAVGNAMQMMKERNHSSGKYVAVLIGSDQAMLLWMWGMARAMQ